MKYIGWTLVIIGGEQIVLSPLLMGDSGIAAAGMTIINLLVFVVPGMAAIWISERGKL